MMRHPVLIECAYSSYAVAYYMVYNDLIVKHIISYSNNIEFKVSYFQFSINHVIKATNICFFTFS